MAALIGSIFAKLQADASGLDSGLRLAGSKVSLFEKTFAGSLNRVDRRWSKTSSLIGGGAMTVAAKAGAMILPLISAGAAVTTLTRALGDFGDIADRAAAAGVDAEYFQGLAYHAGLAGVQTEAIAGALATFAKNAGQATEEYGRLLTSLQKLAPEFVAPLQAARTQEERIKAVADAIAAQTDASRQAAIATAAFGGEGAKLVAIFKRGGGAVDDMIASAKQLDVVVRGDLIARADEFGDKFDTAAKIVDTRLKRAIVALAPSIIGATNLVGNFVDLMGIAADQLNAIENRQYLRPLQNELANTYNAMQPVRDRIAEIEAALAAGGPNGMILRLDLADAKTELAALTAQANVLLARIQELQGYKPPAAPTAPADPLAGMLGRGGPGRIKLAEPFYDANDMAKSRNESAAATIQQAESLSQLLADLDLEAELVGKSSAEQRVLTTIREAGVSATSAEGQAIRGKILAIEAETDAIARLTEEMDFYRGLTRSALVGIGADLREGVGLWDAFGNAAYDALSSIADKALGMAADGIFDLIFGAVLGGFSGGGSVGGTGTGGNLLGGLGLYDSGGYTGIGGKYQPAGVVHKGEYVFDAQSVRRIGVNNLERIRGYADGGYVGGPSVAALNDNAASAAPIVVNYSPQISGANGLTRRELEAALQNDRRAFRSELPTMLSEARRRGSM